MSILKKMTKDEVTPEVRAIFEQVGRDRGNVPNMFRVAAQRPEHMRTMIAHFGVVMNQGTVSPLLKELVTCLVSRRNACTYCLRSHTVLAGKLGATEAQLEALPDFETGPFTDAEKAALAWSDRVNGRSTQVDDELVARVRRHFDEGQIVEITMVVGLFNYFNRFNNALRLEPTQPGEGL